MDALTVTDDEFVAVGTLGKRLDVNRSTVHRRLKRLGVQTFVDPADERARLVRRQDAERILTPRPAPSRGEAAVSAA